MHDMGSSNRPKVVKTYNIHIFQQVAIRLYCAMSRNTGFFLIRQAPSSIVHKPFIKSGSSSLNCDKIQTSNSYMDPRWRRILC